MHRPRPATPTALTLLARTVVALGALLVGSGCSTTVEIPTLASAVERPLLVGAWRSELDGSTLRIEESGIFSVEAPARDGAPPRRLDGTWRFEAANIVFVGAADAAHCAGITGVYEPTVVRDTARFSEIRDDCPLRAERMSWPWKRTKQ